MRIPGADKAIDNLIAWSTREEWAPLREEILADHFDEVLDRFGISVDDIAEKLGGPAIGMVLGCVIEDFFAARFGEDGDNVVDEYLRRRGWKEKVPARRYLEALRDSVLSLYEVVSLIPGKQMTVKDLIRGGEPVVVNEKSGSETAALWDCIAARVVNVNGQTYFTGGMLLFDRQLADDYIAGLEKMLASAQRKMRAKAKTKGETVDVSDSDLRNALLENASPMFVQIWLTDALERVSRPMPEVRNTDGDEIVFAEVRFPITGVERDVIGRLDACRDFDRDDPESRHWTWLDAAKPRKGSRASAKSAGDGATWDTKNDAGARILGSVEIKGRAVILSANSMRRAEHGQGLLAAILADSVGQPMTSVQSLDRVLDERRDSPPLEPQLPPEVAAEAVRIYLDQHYREAIDDPPAHAVVLSVDEKSQIQALDRTQPGLPMKKGRAGTMTHDYKRHGTTTLFAALNVLDGTIIGQNMQRHRHQEFIRFLNRIAREVPADKDIHVILDNYAAHKKDKVRDWLDRHPRWTFHFTPTSCSWLNAVEGFFAKLTRRRLKHGVFHSVVDLQAAINRFIREYNAQNPKPFIWKANPDDIIAARNRGFQTLESIH